MGNEDKQKVDIASLKMIAGRDAHGKAIETLTGYSSTVVRKAFTESKAIVLTGTDQAQAIGSESAVQHNLRSIMAVPLKVREKVIGVVYLDSRLAKGLFTNDDLDLLSAISNHIAIAFETSRMANVEAERRALEKDIALAAAVQSLFLPKNHIFNSEHLTLFGYYQPAASAGGDYWWYHFSETEKKLTVLLGDVTGHGAASAMLTASMAGFIQILAKQEKRAELEDLLGQLNLEFLEIAQDKFSMTMGALELDSESGKLRFLNAGGPSIYLLDGTGKVVPIPAAGTPLGSPTNFNLGIKELSLKDGDRVCILTDGITEMALPNGGMLKPKNFVKILAKTHKMPQKEAGEFIITELKNARGKRALDDDISFVLVDYKSGK